MGVSEINSQNLRENTGFGVLIGTGDDDSKTNPDQSSEVAPRVSSGAIPRWSSQQPHSGTAPVPALADPLIPWGGRRCHSRAPAAPLTPQGGRRCHSRGCTDAGINTPLSPRPARQQHRNADRRSPTESSPPPKTLHFRANPPASISVYTISSADAI